MSDIRQVIDSKTALFGNLETPGKVGSGDSQLLFGETFQITGIEGGYVKGKSVIDGYPGYVRKSALTAYKTEPTHVLRVRASHIYPEPSFKTVPLKALSLMSRFTPDQQTDGYTYIPGQGWMISAHLAPLTALPIFPDLASAALILEGTPYVFGGRSAFGIDCSGLVQVSMLACGYPCPPRDSKDQKGAFGEAIAPEDELKRNDVVFFDGHVGIMVDERRALNATARHMTTLIEDMGALEKAYGKVAGAYRLPLPRR